MLLVAVLATGQYTWCYSVRLDCFYNCSSVRHIALRNSGDELVTVSSDCTLLWDLKVCILALDCSLQALKHGLPLVLANEIHTLVP